MAYLAALHLAFLTQFANQVSTAGLRSAYRWTNVHAAFRLGGTVASFCLALAWVDRFGVFGVWHPSASASATVVVPQLLVQGAAVTVLACHQTCVYFAMTAIQLVGTCATLRRNRRTATGGGKKKKANPHSIKRSLRRSLLAPLVIVSAVLVGAAVARAFFEIRCGRVL